MKPLTVGREVLHKSGSGTLLEDRGARCIVQFADGRRQTVAARSLTPVAQAEPKRTCAR